MDCFSTYCYKCNTSAVGRDCPIVPDLILTIFKPGELAASAFYWIEGCEDDFFWIVTRLQDCTQGFCAANPLHASR